MNNYDFMNHERQPGRASSHETSKIHRLLDQIRLIIKPIERVERSVQLILVMNGVEGCYIYAESRQLAMKISTLSKPPVFDGAISR